MYIPSTNPVVYVLYYSCQIGSNPIQRHFGYNNEYVISPGTYVLLFRKSVAKESGSLVDERGTTAFQGPFRPR